MWISIQHLCSKAVKMWISTKWPAIITWTQIFITKGSSCTDSFRQLNHWLTHIRCRSTSKHLLTNDTLVNTQSLNKLFINIRAKIKSAIVRVSKLELSSFVPFSVIVVVIFRFRRAAVAQEGVGRCGATFHSIFAASFRYAEYIFLWHTRNKHYFDAPASASATTKTWVKCEISALQCLLP